MSCLCGMRESVPAAALASVLGPCPGGTIICLRRGEGCQSSSYPKGKGTYATVRAAAPPFAPVMLACLWD